MNRQRTRILVVDDEELVRESLCGWLRKDGYATEAAADGMRALERVRQEPFSILLLDLKMPGLNGMQVLEQVRVLQPQASVVMMTAYAAVDTAVQAMKNGAADYLVKPFDPEELSVLVEKIAEQQALKRENEVLRKALKQEHRFGDFSTRSPAMQAVYELARAAARGPSTILILGESGTGKEVLARAIHAESPRSAAPFVAISCAALTETLLESELFGHERGAFTGAAARRKGKFEAAAGGTLFLDEIGDISAKLQLDLLRVLEDRRYSRVGGNEVLEADARIIAATNRDLGRAVAEGSFREDLYYRLNVIPVRLPPLRERREDVPLLVEHFLERLTAELSKPLEGVSSEAMAMLLAHGWPGNIRELRNVLERAAVVARGPVLQASDLGLSGLAGDIGVTGPRALSSLEDIERGHIGFVLQQLSGNVTQAARVLGIDRATLYNKIKRYGLRRADDDGESTAGA